tara:strand:- start:643 stop:1527 length:885 start_codon:yes stop_codon:yes gene_type:complete
MLSLQPEPSLNVSLRRTCPDDGKFQFNTQIVFGTTGALLQKYHKSHLFPDDLIAFDYPSERVQMATFNSSFNVMFGQFICFDMFFVSPEILRAKALGIENFVFSTYWENQGTLPLIPAIQIQQAWSRGVGVNLLASNIGFGFEDSGSGIYSAGTSDTYVLNLNFNTVDNVLLTRQLPRAFSPSSNSTSVLISVDDMNDIMIPMTGKVAAHARSAESISNTSAPAISVPVGGTLQYFRTLQHSSLNVPLVHGDVKCEFSLTCETTVDELYVMMAYRFVDRFRCHFQIFHILNVRK